jgi:hypothetical protein
MITLKSVFHDVNAALLAGERVREVGGKGACVRVRVPNRGGKVMELSVLPDESSAKNVAIWSLAMGAAALIITWLATHSLALALVATFYGLGTGAMMAYWLTGEFHRGRLLRNQREVPNADEVTLTAVVPDREAAGKAREALESSGGQVSVQG